jgi:hypothetical protein
MVDMRFKRVRKPLTIPYTGDKLLRFLMTALGPLDSSCEYGDWFRIGAAVYSASEGADEGLEAFDWWSSRSRKKYPGRRRIEYQWKTFGRGPGTIQLPTLIHYLKQEGISWRELLDRFEKNVAPHLDS